LRLVTNQRGDRPVSGAVGHPNCCRVELAIGGKDRPPGIGQTRTALSAPTCQGFDELGGKAAVHLIDQNPAAPVTHPERASSRCNRTFAVYRFEQIGFAGTDRGYISTINLRFQFEGADPHELSLAQGVVRFDCLVSRNEVHVLLLRRHYAAMGVVKANVPPLANLVTARLRKLNIATRFHLTPDLFSIRGYARRHFTTSNTANRLHAG
jgi:hypothetical protein